MGESKRKRSRKYQSVTVIVISDSSDDDDRPKKLLSPPPSSHLPPSTSLLLATRPKHPKRSRKETTKPVKGTPKTRTKVQTVDQYPGFSSDWSSEDENMSVPKSTVKQESMSDSGLD